MSTAELTNLAKQPILKLLRVHSTIDLPGSGISRASSSFSSYSLTVGSKEQLNAGTCIIMCAA